MADKARGRKGKPSRTERQKAMKRARLLWLIAHPMRRRILRDLKERGVARSALQMSRDLRVPPAVVAHHVKILCDFGAIAPADEKIIHSAVERYYLIAIEDDPPIDTLLEETRAADEDEK